MRKALRAHANAVCVFVCMYLCQDCLIGAGLGLALLRACVPLATHWVAWMVTGGLQALAIQAAVYIAALSLYPKPLAFTTRLVSVSAACTAWHCA